MIIYYSAQIGVMLFLQIGVWAILFWILDQTSGESKTYSGGIGMAFLDSYRLALGDFGDLIVRFEDNKFKYTFWFLFLVGTIISLLIILNMVIAVMSSTFEQVQEENDAYVRREKLMLMQENWYRMPDFFKKRFREAKYLVLIQIEPDVDNVSQVDSTSYIIE